MSDIFHETNVTRSRMPRQCSWCAQPIEIGQPYRGYSWRDGTDYGREFMHPECYAAMERLLETEGPWLLWSPGDFARGCECESGRCECDKQARLA